MLTTMLVVNLESNRPETDYSLIECYILYLKKLALGHIDRKMFEWLEPV